MSSSSLLSIQNGDGFDALARVIECAECQSRVRIMKENQRNMSEGDASTKVTMLA